MECSEYYATVRPDICFIVKSDDMCRYLPVLYLSVAAMAASVPPTPKGVKISIPQNKQVPVVVELFTFDGCTGCALADEMLAQFELRQPVPAAEIILLDEHLDFASGLREGQVGRQIGSRQTDYNRFFRNESIYTPQVVIGGQSQLLEESENNLKDEIARAIKNLKTHVQIEFQSASVATIKVDKLPDGSPLSDIWMAVTENKVETPWPGAESDHRSMRHTSVVRSLVLIGRVDSSGPIVYSIHLRFNPRWKRDNLKYVVFVQDPASRRILGATSVAP